VVAAVVIGLYMVPAAMVGRRDFVNGVKDGFFRATRITDPEARTSPAANVAYYLTNAGSFLGWPVLIAGLAGAVLASHPRTRGRYGFLWLTALFYAVPATGLVFPRPMPHYLNFFYPLIALFAGAGLGWLLRYLEGASPSAQVVWVFRAAVVVVVVLLMLPGVYRGVAAGSADVWRTVARATEEVIEEKGLSEPRIYTSFWPDIITERTGVETSNWLTDSLVDARTMDPDIDKDPVSILAERGGLVVIEDEYTRYFLLSTGHPTVGPRKRAIRRVRERAEPVKVLGPEDLGEVAGGFPFPQFAGNKVEIYLIRPGASR
jgi:hypothetical protein